MRRRQDFTAALRRGAGQARVATPTVVAHLTIAPNPPADAAPPVLAGFVVSRAVGPAVVRNRVRRRLRHLVRARLAALPPGSRLVVRALPTAATASGEVLRAHVDEALSAASRRADRTATAGAPGGDVA
jgi:ribonuclease P protein component